MKGGKHPISGVLDKQHKGILGSSEVNKGRSFTCEGTQHNALFPPAWMLLNRKRGTRPRDPTNTESCLDGLQHREWKQPRL